MSKSRRHITICGRARRVRGTDSEKKNKRIVNRMLRRINNKILPLYLDEFQPIDKQEIYEVSAMQKDGKFFFDSEKFPELMRK